MRLGPGSVVACGILLLVVTIIPSSGCSNQSEGERCKWFNSTDNSVNGTDDCQDGLICKQGSQLISNPNYDACCPPDCTLATTYICSCPAGQLQTDAGFNRDGEADVTSGDADAATDAPPKDTSSDTPSEAPGDAPSEGDAPNDAPSDSPNDVEAG